MVYADSGLTGMAPPDPAALLDLLITIPKLDSLALKVPVSAPWDTPDAARLDSETLESWLRRNSTGSERFMHLARAAVRPIFGAEPRELSMLFVLFFIAASGDESTPGTFERNFSTCNGAQQDRVDGGAQQIASRMAAQLGRRVVHRAAVRRIVTSGAHVEVICDRYVSRARHVIVALPPVLAGRIGYEPALPAERVALGRNRDGDVLERIHGRRGPIGRARRKRGARRALRRRIAAIAGPAVPLQGLLHCLRAPPTLRTVNRSSTSVTGLGG
jgi:monoamine oxidase